MIMTIFVTNAYNTETDHKHPKFSAGGTRNVAPFQFQPVGGSAFRNATIASIDGKFQGSGIFIGVSYVYYISYSEKPGCRLNSN